MKVLAFGEILWDVIEGEYYLGGAPVNFATHFAKCGGKSSIISAVGKDELGLRAVEQIKALSVDTSFISILPNLPTGTVDVFLDNGLPDYTIHENVAFDSIPLDGLEKILHDTFDIFYFGSLIQRSDISRKTLTWILDHLKYKYVFYDINLRKNYYTKDIIRYSLNHCTIFKINTDEVRIIANLFYGQIFPLEEFAKRIATDFQIETIIITAAELGCYLLTDGKFDYAPGVPITLVDAVGAGDAFSAAFMYQYCQGTNVLDAIIQANKVGAFVASAKGAIPDYSEEIKKMLSIRT